MSSKLEKNELDKLRAVPITTLLGLPPTTRRLSVRCPLPNHNDGSPSFVLYPNNTFKCYGCNAIGQGSIDFLEALGFGFKEIVDELSTYV